MTAIGHDVMARVADVCADDAESLALSIVRMVAAGYSTGDVACWDMAYAGAERVLSPASAGRVVASLTSLLRIMRAERHTPWNFMPVTCCRVTRDEAGIVGLINAARGGDPRSVAAAACAVSGRAGSPSLVAAACIAGEALDEAAGTLVPDPHRPRSAPARFH